MGQRVGDKGDLRVGGSGTPHAGLARYSEPVSCFVSSRILPLGAVLGLQACFGNEATEFPPGLEPLEENLAPVPLGDGSLEVVSGEDDGAWVHARGHLAAAPALVWAALKEPENVVNTWATDSQSLELDVEPEYEHSFLVSYTVESLITVDWDEMWRYGTVDGVPEAPKLAIARHQKVFGSTFIRSLEGSFIVVALDDSESEIQMIQRVDAAQVDAGDIITTFETIFANLELAVR